MNLEEYNAVDWQFADEEWLNEELQQALDALPSAKHRTTVLRLAEARATGKNESEIWKLKDVCSKKTWYGPYRSGVHMPGWRDDPLVKRALNLALARVASFQESGIVANIKETTRLIANEAPKAVMVLSILMDEADSDETKRKAANDILDRLQALLGGPGSGSKMTLSETRTITFDLSSLPLEMLNDIVDGE